MLELILLTLVVLTAVGSIAEAWYERDFPWHFAKYFLLFLSGLLFFVLR
jgi:hypothetical protein